MKEENEKLALEKERKRLGGKVYHSFHCLEEYVFFSLSLIYSWFTTVLYAITLLAMLP